MAAVPNNLSGTAHDHPSQDYWVMIIADVLLTFKVVTFQRKMPSGKG